MNRNRRLKSLLPGARKGPARSDAPGAPDGIEPGGEASGSIDALAAAGWIVPRGLRSGGTPSWTLVGTVASPVTTPVDGGGMVVGEGWALDWWVGADDRWHVPAREASVRQQLLDDAPVVETLMRVPGGDAIHRAYGIRSPRDVGDEWVVSEVHNSTAIPFALALVLRPMVADGLGSISEITVEPTGGGVGRDEACLVRVDGRPAVVLPRAPARYAAGNAEIGEVFQVVSSGRAVEQPVTATCPDGLASLALVFPLTHTSIIRVLVPVGDVGDNVAYPSAVPDPATVASGWSVHRRGMSIAVPEPKISTAFKRAMTHVQLAHDGDVVRRDGHRSRSLEPGATEVILGALDVLDHPLDVASVLTHWPDVLGAEPGPEVDALVLTAVSRHWLFHRVAAMLYWVLPEVAAAVERIDRAHRRGSIGTVAARRRAVAGLRAASAALDAARQPDAAVRVAELAEKVARDLPANGAALAADRLVAAAERIADGDPSGLDALRSLLSEASVTGTWPGPAPSSGGGAISRLMGDDLAASGALVLAVRNLLVSERPEGLALLPSHPAAWYGSGVEIHDAPTASGKISFAVRWHGRRPALLWELVPHEGTGPVTLTAPGLAPGWSTTEAVGEALLPEVDPPAEALGGSSVPEHSIIGPIKRRRRSTAEPASGQAPEGGGSV